MPWRDEPTPYHVLVSEIMLQQTQVATVIPYYLRFLEAFPDLETLAAAPQEKVLKLWEGLGYYSRARNLQACAKALMANHGQFPRDFDALLHLPGLGPYTAAAIASLAFGQPVATVDGNVLRIRTRMTADSTPLGSTALRNTCFNDLTEILRTSGCPPRVFNQAMMELGAMDRTPSPPGCAGCPVAEACPAHAEGRECDFPCRPPRKKPPHCHVVIGLLHDPSGALLILQRPAEKMLAGLWECPGGRVANGESPTEAARRTIFEDTGLHVTVGKELGAVEHAYSHFSITLHAFQCSRVDSNADPQCPRPWRWANIPDLKNYPFPKANLKLFAKLGLLEKGR